MSLSSSFLFIYHAKSRLNTPVWVELCAREGMCDEYLDAMSCMQSHAFHTDTLRQQAQVYTEQGFLSENEADIFLSEIPVLGETEEVEYTVSDQMLETESSDPAFVPQTHSEKLATMLIIQT